MFIFVPIGPQVASITEDIRGGSVVSVRDIEGPKRALENGKSGQEVAKNGQESVNRYHVDYWRRRLFKKTYTSGGRRRLVEEWSIRLQHLGRREAFALGSKNAAAAATKAKEIATYLEANGWAATRAKFKPDAVRKVKAPTVGEYIVAARAVAGITPSTFNAYAVKLRSLVAEVEGIEPPTTERPVINHKTGLPMRNRKTGEVRMRKVDLRFDNTYGGAAAWRAKVEAVPLDRLTPSKVQRWVTDRLQKVAGNPAKLQSARTTTNSILRACGSLFAPRIIRHLGHLTLPSPLPFEGVERPSAPRRRFVSSISPQILNAKAEAELRDATGDDAAQKHELYSIFLLALYAGLRRDEIDTLQWSQFDWDNACVRVETNEHTAAKSDNSENSVGLDPDVLAYFKGRFLLRRSSFVIESPVKPRPDAVSYHHYRCNRLFAQLIEWLRDNGVTARNPLHTLRKEFGSFIARKYGIFAASEALRHGDIRLTRDYYLARNTRATFGPSELSKEEVANPAINVAHKIQG